MPAGAAAGLLTPGLPIVPRKGHLAITDRYPCFCRHQLVELGYLTSAHVMTNESVAFNVQPRSTGQVLIGSSRELVGWDAVDQSFDPAANARSRGGVHARIERTVGHSMLDGISSRDARQASADRSVGRDAGRVDRRRSRRTRDHDVARDRAADRRSARRAVHRRSIRRRIGRSRVHDTDERSRVSAETIELIVDGATRRRRRRG